MFRSAFAFVIACLLAVPARGQQDDPFETHLYNVEFLTIPVPDHAGQDFSLSPDSIGTAVAMESAMNAGRLSSDDLIKLIKTNVAEDTWDHVSAAITFSNGVLTVTNRKSVHDKIAQYLNYWRGFFGKMIAIDATILSVDPMLLAKVRAAGIADRPVVLPPEHLRQLLEAAREGKLAELVRSMRVTAHPGQRVSLDEIFSQHYIRDYDVQIATAAVALDPVVDVYSTGTSVDVRAHLEPFGNAITLEVRAGASDPEALEERKLKLPKEIGTASPLEGTSAQPRGAPVTVAVEARLQLPRTTNDRVRTTLTVRNKETAITGSVLRKGRNVLFLLTPAVVVVDEKPSPEPVFDEQRLLRLYDISPLTRGVQDWAGPRMGIRGPMGAGGPLTGATFTLEEPAVLMTSTEVASMIKNRIAADSWGNKRNSIDATQSSTLVIRQKPEVLKEIDRFLGTILMARAQMITTEAVVIGFRKGSRLDWEKDVPALAPGGYFVEQAGFDKLFEEACKDAKVRLVEMAEITGFPQERVHILRANQENHLLDYEPQVSTLAAMHDPIIGTFTTGFVLDVRPHYIHGNDQIAVDFRGSLTTGQLKETEVGTPATGPLQLAQGRVLTWNSNATCVKGKWSLVGLETVGRGADAEEWAVFVRARQNVLK